GRLLSRMRIEVTRIFDHVLRPAGRDQVDLLDEVEELVAVPLRVAEAAIARIGTRNRLPGFSHHAPERTRPEIDEASEKAVLRLGGPLRFGQPVFADPGERLEDLAEPFAELDLRAA